MRKKLQELKESPKAKMFDSLKATVKKSTKLKNVWP